MADRDIKPDNVPDDHRALLTLHAVYHERDFRVRVNDPTINFVRRQLALIVEQDPADGTCPACAAGLKHDDLQPEACDR